MGLMGLIGLIFGLHTSDREIGFTVPVTFPREGS